MSKKINGGFLLLAAGAALLLSQIGVIPGQLFLLILGLGFCLAYLLFGGRKEYGSIGVLIPGTVLLAVGGFAALESYLSTTESLPALFFMGLGLSFLTVFLAHTFWFKEMDHGERFWPLYPSAGLLLLAGIITASTTWELEIPLQALNYLWVAALLGTGGWLLLKGRKEKQNNK